MNDIIFLIIIDIIFAQTQILFRTYLNPKIIKIILLLLLKKVSNARLGDQSEDPSATIPIHRMKEEKGKTGRDKKGESS